MFRQMATLLISLISVSAWSAQGNDSLRKETDHQGWFSVGPAPPAIEAQLASDPASHTIYIASFGGGVLKSTNDGDSFTPVNNGLDDHAQTAMVMMPHNPNVVYVSGFKTVDGGAHWNPDAIGGVTVIIDPSNPNILYAGSSPSGGVTKSTDGGDTSFDASEGMGFPAVFALAIDPRHTNVLYAGTQGKGAFKSVDAAATWKPLRIDTSVPAFLVDPDDSNIVYAGTNGNGVYKSTNAGASFARIGSPPVGVILSLAKREQTLYAGTATRGLWASQDGGRTWTNTEVTSGTVSLSIDSAGSILVGTSFDGAFIRRVSDDEWHSIGLRQLKRCACQNGHAIAVDPGDPDHIFFTTNGPLLVSNDGGHRWNEGGNMGLTALAPRGIAFDPQDPRRVYAGSFTGGGFFKSDDHGQHWKRRLFGSASIYVTGISVDPEDHSIYAATLDGARDGEVNGIWKSIDFGDTFIRIDRAPKAPAGQYIGLSGRTVTVDPQRHRTIYFADNTAHPGIWRSQNAGETWMQVDDTDAEFSVTVDPTDSNIVYAATRVSGVLKSIDGGNTFARKSNGLPDGEATARTGSVQVNPTHPNVLYVGYQGVGVYKSTDAAETWFPINSGLDTPESQTILGMAMDSSAPNTLYIATPNSIYKTVTGGR